MVKLLFSDHKAIKMSLITASRTLRNVLTKVKDPSPKNSRVGTVYKIECAECPASYFGETGEHLNAGIKNTNAA